MHPAQLAASKIKVTVELLRLALSIASDRRNTRNYCDFNTKIYHHSLHTACLNSFKAAMLSKQHQIVPSRRDLTAAYRRCLDDELLSGIAC